MKNNELLKKYAGISTRIRRIFAYHYDQIQREVQTEMALRMHHSLRRYDVTAPQSRKYLQIHALDIFWSNR